MARHRHQDALTSAEKTLHDQSNLLPRRQLVSCLGGGGITNLAMIIVSDVVTLEQRGRYQGITGSMVGLGSVTGPFLAAAFVVSRAAWRGLFWLLAPPGALNGLLAYLYLPSKEPTATVRESVGKVDWMGPLTSSVGAIFLLIPISGGLTASRLCAVCDWRC